MGRRLPQDILSQPTDQAARLLALSYLDQAKGAQSRLTDSAHPRSLHAFRVAVRRLRSCLRAYRPALDGIVTPKVRRRLRRLTRDTNAARDAEVQLAWLRGLRGHLSGEELAGLGWLVGRLEERTLVLLDPAKARVSKRFRTLNTKLRARLHGERQEIEPADPAEPSRFGHVTASLARAYAETLWRSLGSLHGLSEAEAAHKIRIRGKRLRYLLEPLSPGMPRVRPPLERLKQLQTDLGLVHDMEVLIGSLRTRTGFPALDAGLTGLRRRAGKDAQIALARFHDRWSSSRSATFLEGIESVADELESISGSSPAERPYDNGAPTPLLTSGAEAPGSSWSLTAATPLPLPFRLQPQPRLR